MEHLTVIITSLFGLVGTVVAAWFAYNQHTKNKNTDLKIEQVKKDSEEKSAVNNRHISNVYGEMYELIHKLDADRCFIIQPHPQNKHHYISVIYEVDRKGVSLVKDLLQNISLSDIAQFQKELSSNCWLHYDDIDNQVPDMRIRSLMRLSGSTNIGIRQLINSQNDWIGSLVVENTTDKPFTDELREIMKNTANTIQYILPSIN